MVNIAPIFIGLVLFAFAGLIGRKGWRKQRRRSLVTETETTSVRSIDDEGLVELKGTVSAPEPFRSPIAGDESVLSAWEIEEWDEAGQTDMWETRAKGVSSVPFGLDDGTGEVRVAVGDHAAGPSGNHLDIELGPVNVDQMLSSGVSVDSVLCSFDRFPVETTIPPDADPPERIAEFVREQAEIAPQTDSITNLVDFGNKHGERRYYEATIAPDEEIYLLGKAEAVSDATYPLGPEDVRIVPPETEGTLIASNQSEGELAADLGRYKTFYAIAAAFGVGGIALLLHGAGLV